jgi:oligopeptide transport system permease protein
MCFVLIKLLPITIDVSFGKDADILKSQLEARGYYKPIPEQFILSLKRIILDGDFGIGTNMPEFRNKPVWDTFVNMLPPTILLNVYSSLFSVPIGIALGIFAALKKNKWQDHTISTAVMVFISVPGFVTASLILYFLCFKWNLLPKTMLGGYDYFTWPMFKSMIPAILSMSFGSIAGYARFPRAELTEVLTSEFMLLARTKGLTKRQATTRHALRNAMVPIFPSIVGEFISVLSGSLVIERIFSVPGVGRLYLNAINSIDYDFFMMLSGFYLLVGLAAGLVIDLSYGVIDPRIRMGAK